MDIDSKTQRNLFMPILKTAKGHYEAVLSDTSIDRDNELMSKSLLDSWAKNSAYIPALMDHKNEVLSNVAKWENPRVVQKDGHNALVMTPRFFKSNPNAKILQGMIDEGAELGVSIGAIPKDYDEVDVQGKEYLMWTKAELLEASFTPIPANRHARIYVAKSYNLAKEILKNTEGLTMEDKNPEIDKLKVQLEAKNSEVEALNKQIEEMTKKSTDNEKKTVESQKSVDELKVELEKAKTETQKQIEGLKASFNEELDKKIKDHEIKLKEGPGYMKQDAGKDNAGEGTKEKKFSSEGLLKAYIGVKEGSK